MGGHAAILFDLNVPVDGIPILLNWERSERTQNQVAKNNSKLWFFRGSSTNQRTASLAPYFFLPTLPAPAQIKKVINDTGFPPAQKFYKITLVHFLWHVLLIPTILFLGKNHLLIDELMAFLFDFSTVITGSIDNRFYLLQLCWFLSFVVSPFAWNCLLIDSYLFRHIASGIKLEIC